jgi:hypothetical protein
MNALREVGFLGPAPDPVAPLRGDIAIHNSLRSRATLFASFSGKRRVSFNRMSALRAVGFPDPVAPFRRDIAIQRSSAKQSNASCFFFWKKKNI